MNIEAFISRLEGVRPAGDGSYMAKCPAHEDSHQSMSVSNGRGKILIYDHANCTPEEIVSALGLKMSDLFSEPQSTNGSTRKPQKPYTDYVIESVHYYQKADSTVHYRVQRKVNPLDRKDKTYPQHPSNGNGGWVTGKGCMDGVERILYRLPELLKVGPGGLVFIPEGERCVEVIRELGLAATCNSGGAGKFAKSGGPDYCEPLRGLDVVILPDPDKAGRPHGQMVAAMLRPIARSVKVFETPGEGDVYDWIKRGGTREQLLSLAADAAEWAAVGPEPAPEASFETGLSLNDFHGYMPTHQFICVPSREMWPAASVNAKVAPVPTGKLKKDGSSEYESASAWLDRERSVEQMTWWPGQPMVIPNRLVSDGGWIDQKGCSCFNLYRPPRPNVFDGNPMLADRWLQHIDQLYPDDVHHIVRWLAQRVQQPAIKINHALVLGGKQGIGKDSLLEPIREAIGTWNFVDVSPPHLFGRFNPFVRSVILRLNEAHDLGDQDRFSFYEHSKIYTASPPNVLRCDEKNLREHSVLNCCGVVLTTNHKTGGIYLPADDRRHYVAWSDTEKDNFSDQYWNDLYRWYEREGYRHVAAYLASLDISGFDPKAPPPKTEAFWTIVDANRAPEDAELADVLDDLGTPNAITLDDLVNRASGDFRDWLSDRKSRRQIPHRLEAAGYVNVRNPDAKDGLWRVNRSRMVVYAKREMSLSERISAAQERTK